MRAQTRQNPLPNIARLICVAMLCGLFFEATQRIGPAFESALATEQAVLDSIQTTRVQKEVLQDPLHDAIARAERLAFARTRITMHLNPEAGEEALTDLFEASQGAELRRETAELIVETQASDWPADYRGEFLRAIAPAAIVSAREHQLPVSVTLAQAILESGWGRSALSAKHNNLFGMKAGKNDEGIRLKTTEGTSQRITAKFRTYEDWTASISDHDRLLGESPRYSKAKRHWTHWRTYVDKIASTYATDPHYAHRLGQIIRHYDLDRFDNLVIHAVGRDQAVALRASLEHRGA